jgi:hypothetical protein
VLKLNTQTHTASYVSQYTHGPHFDTQYMGNTQPVAGNRTVVGWGSEQNFTEYTSSGQQILDAYMPFPDITYRALLEPWVGLPLYPPSGAARTSGGRTTVYASWNGATKVVSWKVLNGGKVVATAHRSGFETRIAVPSSGGTFTVQALDAGGRVLGTSKAFSARG